VTPRREATQSLELSPDELEPVSHPSLAIGTHDAHRENTRADSPSGRAKPSQAIARGSGGRPPPIPGLPDEPEAYLGAVLGSYRILELLGKGGMGHVYRAEHVKLGREVALKLLRSDYSKRRDSVARFFQEARTVNRVRHRNIVDVTDFVELEDGTTFIIMELLSGISLGKWARTGIDLPRALAVLVQICDGLGAAHAVGVVHRDLKPDNVIVIPTADGAELVKLLDFGVAKLLNRDDEDVGFQTAAGSVIGTPAYMSPEQAGGMALDHRSDIYSLGAIMYELFCGQPMFRGRSFGEYVRKHLTEMPIPPRQTPNGGGVDPHLEALILRCLEKEPTMRFNHIYELRDALLHMLGSMETSPPGYLTGSAIRPMITALPQMQPMPTPISQLSQLHPSAIQYSQISPPATQVSPPTPWWVWLSGGMFAVALGIAGALWYASRTDDKKPAAATALAKPAPAPSLSATPIGSGAGEPGAKSAMVEVMFDSLPSGSLYADGRSAELCKTPCTLELDTKDGAKRFFIIKSDGYKDGTVAVDLGADKRDYRLTLERAVPEPDETPQRPRPHPTGTPTTHPGVKDDAKKPVVDAKKPATDDHLMKPEDDHPSKKPDKKPNTIDPTETSDPFRPK
jgi:serine/threonine protein kinase